MIRYFHLMSTIDIMLSIELKSPQEIMNGLGSAIRSLRLAKNWSRGTLAARSGVPESSIKRFELTGQIGLGSLVEISIALDRADELQKLFLQRSIPTIREMDAIKTRLRGSK